MMMISFNGVFPPLLNFLVQSYFLQIILFVIHGEFLNDQHVARNFCSRYGAICGALFGNKIKLKVIKDEIELCRGEINVSPTNCACLWPLWVQVCFRIVNTVLILCPVRDSESMLYPIF